MQLLNTLYVTLPESRLRLDNDTLRVEVEEETRLRVPLHHLHAVVCFGYVGISAPLMHRLADEGIALVLLDANGRFKARLEGRVTGNVLLPPRGHPTRGSSSRQRDCPNPLVPRTQKHPRLESSVRQPWQPSRRPQRRQPMLISCRLSIRRSSMHF